MDAGSALIVSTKAVPLIVAGSYDRVRVTLKCVGPYAVRIGADETIGWGDQPFPGGTYPFGPYSTNELQRGLGAGGFTLAPGEERTWEQPGTDGVWAMASALGDGATRIDYMSEVVA